MYETLSCVRLIELSCLWHIRLSPADRCSPDTDRTALLHPNLTEEAFLDTAFIEECVQWPRLFKVRFIGVRANRREYQIELSFAFKFVLGLSQQDLFFLGDLLAIDSVRLVASWADMRSYTAEFLTGTGPWALSLAVVVLLGTIQLYFIILVSRLVLGLQNVHCLVDTVSRWSHIEYVAAN